MKVLSRAEAHLVTLTRAVVLGGERAELARLLSGSHLSPQTLGPSARALLEDTLSRGVGQALLRGGGWVRRAGKRLTDGPPPKLEFTSALVRLLNWVLEARLQEPEVRPLTLAQRLTPAEELVVVLLFDRATPMARQSMARQPQLRALPLVQLVWPDALSLAGPLEPVTPWGQATHGPFVEGLQRLLVRRWVELEQAKGLLSRPEVALRLGEAQARVLATLLDAARPASARVQAGFLLEVARRWLEAPAQFELSGLDPESSLSERTRARRASVALLRALPRLRTWDTEHRQTRFIDDDYELAQALVREWEPFGDRGFTAAEQLVAQVDAL
jgi:hypothetical protein